MHENAMRMIDHEPGAPSADAASHAIGVVHVLPTPSDALLAGARDATLVAALEAALAPARVVVLSDDVGAAPYPHGRHAWCDARAGRPSDDARAPASPCAAPSPSPSPPSTPSVARAIADSTAALDLFDAARRLAARGARLLLLPADTPPAVAAALARELPLPVRVRDPDEERTARLLAEALDAAPRPFKIGVVGGVGPAATVDFLDKLVRATPAACDQDHLRVVVEQNPQIPDRTAHLVGRSTANPAVALYAACLSVIAQGAGLIAIPCNTAHAYAALLQARLPVPIVNLLDETIDHVVQNHGAGPSATPLTVGLLATSGTIASGVYREAAARRGVTLMLPDATHQERVMASIYGPRGIKAGFSEGACVADLLAAVAHLAQAGANVLILGCTELPLLLEDDRHFPIGDTHVALVDPTRVLAGRCVALALAARERAAADRVAGSAADRLP